MARGAFLFSLLMTRLPEYFPVFSLSGGAYFCTICPRRAPLQGHCRGLSLKRLINGEIFWQSRVGLQINDAQFVLILADLELTIVLSSPCRVNIVLQQKTLRRRFGSCQVAKRTQLFNDCPKRPKYHILAQTAEYLSDITSHLNIFPGPRI